MPNLIINGAQGKLGRVTAEFFKNRDDFNIVGLLTRGDDLGSAIETQQADIVIELTRADCVYENARTIIEAGARPVIGASGLMENDIEALKALCDQKARGGIIAPNFSIGALLMMRFAAEAAAYFPEVEIIEAHHQQKLDAPSGTALKTAELIDTHRNAPPSALPLKELVSGARGGKHQNVPIHSIRLPGVLARQEVVFGATGETFSITHNTLDRSCFMPGVLLACQKVMQLNRMIYGLEQLI